ncbi:MAG: hypothetical protein LBC39_05365 [Methanobrevibacter sp.]|jgi:hypothetical protein|nr:hypothetical protein [Candidatus Methanovirga aequatorialis]
MMDKRIKIVGCILIIFFISSIAFGAVKGALDVKRGKLIVDEMQMWEKTYGLNETYSVHLRVRNLENINYLRMQTTYFDNNGNILIDNPKAYESTETRGSSFPFYVSENIGYRNVGNISPVSVTVNFYDKPNTVKSSDKIYETSFYFYTEVVQ